MYYKFSDNSSCEHCVFLEKATRDNPDYCNRILIDYDSMEFHNLMEESICACTKKNCPHHISLSDLKYIQDKYEPF